MSGALVISEECLGWARLAGFEHRSDDTAGIVVLWSATGSRYCIRQRGRGRLELSHADGGDDPHPILFAASMEILKYHLVGMFGDDVREEVELPYLEMSVARTDVAQGYAVGEMQRGYRILTRTDGTPVAAAPDPELSLVSLVPLSHFLGLSIAALKRAFLAEDGAPLLRADGRYA